MSNITCEICKKRSAKFPTIVKVGHSVEKEIQLCKFCHQQYRKMKDRYLVNVYFDLIKQYQKVNDND